MNFYNIGKIINTHGIKGEVKVQSETDFPENRFQVDKNVYININGENKEFTIDGVRVHKGFYLLHFKDYDSINDVELFKTHLLQISDDELSKDDLQPGEYYYHQIIGLNVKDTDGNYLGQIKDIMQTGSNDVWVVKRDNQKDLLLPKINQVIKKVDLHNQQVIVELIEGLD